MILVLLMCNSDTSVFERKFPNFKKSSIKGNDMMLINNNCREFGVITIPDTKVASTALITQMLSNYNIEAIIGSGNAASLIDLEAPISTIAISKQAIQYDVNFCSLGYCPGVIPSQNMAFFKASEYLYNLAYKTSIKLGFRTIIGNYGSADRFVNNAIESNQIKSQFGVQFIDNEAGTIGEMACSYNLPYVIVKGISNYANCNANFDYKNNRINENLRSATVVANMIADNM